jgi:hypothetical protein
VSGSKGRNTVELLPKFSSGVVLLALFAEVESTPPTTTQRVPAFSWEKREESKKESRISGNEKRRRVLQEKIHKSTH